MDGRCDWNNPKQLKKAGCSNKANLGYLGRELCDDHWNELCALQDQGKEDKALRRIGLEPNKPEKTLPEEVEDLPVETQTPDIVANQDIVEDCVSVGGLAVELGLYQKPENNLAEENKIDEASIQEQKPVSIVGTFRKRRR